MQSPVAQQSSSDEPEELLPYALPPSSTPAPSSPSSSSPHFHPLPLDNSPHPPSRRTLNTTQEPWQGFGRYPLYSPQVESDLFPTFARRLRLDEEVNGSSRGGKAGRKLRKAPPGLVRLPGRQVERTGSGKRTAKERFGSGSGKTGEEKRRSSLGALACGVSGLSGWQVETPAEDAPTGYGLGVQAEKGSAGPSAHPSPVKKRSSLFSRSLPRPTSIRAKVDSRTRHRQNDAAHPTLSMRSGSEGSFVFVEREKKGELQFYRDREEEASSDVEVEETATPTVVAHALSDAETTGENAQRRRPVLTARPRYPLHPKAPSPAQQEESQPPPARTKHFKLPTLPSPPLHGGSAILLPTPAGLTDVSFQFDEGGSGFFSAAGTFVEPEEGEGGLFPTAQESPSSFREGAASFRTATDGHDHDGDEAPSTTTPPHHTAQPSTASSTWMNDFLRQYGDSSETSTSAYSASPGRSGNDAASVVSSDAPLADRYPQRLPLLQNLSLHALPTSSGSPLPSPSFSSFPTLHLPLPTSPSSPAPPRPPRSPFRVRPPTPLLDLNAPPPSPSYLIHPKPRSPGEQGLIGFVKGKELPERVVGGGRGRR